LERLRVGRGINNMYALTFRLHPDLAVIDGFEGMEGNGPTRADFYLIHVVSVELTEKCTRNNIESYKNYFLVLRHDGPICQ
jgi:hypothetical protein